MTLHIFKLPSFTKFQKIFVSILLCTMVLTVQTSCNSNRFNAPKLSETDAPSYENETYPKIAAMDFDKADFTNDKVDQLAEYSMLIVPAEILKESENIISIVKKNNSKIKILMYQSSLNDMSRLEQTNKNDLKIDESWYYHKAPTTDGQTLEQRRVLINNDPIINLSGELTKQLINNMKTNYAGLKNVDGIYLDNFRTDFNVDQEFQADINDDGKDEDYFTIVGTFPKSLNNILSEAKTLTGENGSIIVNTNSWGDDASIIQGYTGITNRNNSLSILHWRGNALGRYDAFIALVEKTGKKNLSHVIEENITYDIDPSKLAKITVGDITSDGQKVMRIGLCTSLLGESYFMIDFSTFLFWFPEYDVDIGKPKAEYKRLDSYLHVREFENGYVIVNPNPGAVEHNFSEEYTDITSGERSTTFSIAGRDGRIFKKN